MNRKQIKELRSFLQKLEDNFDLPKYNYDIDFETEEIFLQFPNDDDELNTYHIDELTLYYDQIDSFEIINDNKVISKNITQRVIEINKNFSYYLYLGLFENKLENGVILRVRDSPLLIGLAAVKQRQYHKYSSPCSKHTAVEIVYPSGSLRLTEEEEDEMLKVYFFEIANFFKVSINYKSYYLNDNDYLEEENYLKIEKLEKYNFGMDLFIKANSSLSDDLKFLYYYKIFEYFAPIYSKMEAYDLLKKKLDNVNSQNHDSKYLNSFFELAKKYDKSLRDKELVKSLINSTFDLVDVYDFLPESIRLRKIKVKSITYKSNKDSLEKITEIIGDILYATRNQIVHAKSNYEATGLECPEEDLDKLNNFMHKASYSVIKWYNRLPDYQK